MKNLSTGGRDQTDRYVAMFTSLRFIGVNNVKDQAV